VATGPDQLIISRESTLLSSCMHNEPWHVVAVLNQKVVSAQLDDCDRQTDRQSCRALLIFISRRRKQKEFIFISQTKSLNVEKSRFKYLHLCTMTDRRTVPTANMEFLS